MDMTKIKQYHATLSYTKNRILSSILEKSKHPVAGGNWIEDEVE
jgi:hypothetical protein